MTQFEPAKLTSKTPIEELKGFSKKTRIFIKRDDLNGLLISGNKARKLEYLVADAKRNKCDIVVTCGAVQSNHCRTTAAFAKHFGFECHIFLRTSRHTLKTYAGNLLLDELLGAEVFYITPSQYKRRMEIMEKHSHRLRRKGKKPYVIPEGGSNDIGALGYIDCLKEMADTIKQNQIEAIYCAVGSGGTYAGLLLGKKLLNLNTDLNGVIVCDNIKHFQERISGICNTAIQKFALPIEISDDNIQLIDGYVGRGYGIPYPEELEAIRKVAKTGIILDPVYTGKAFYGMLNHLRKSHYKNVVFVHTGGIFSIFAYQTDLSNAIRRGKKRRSSSSAQH